MRLCEVHTVAAESRFATVMPSTPGEACPTEAVVTVLPTWEEGNWGNPNVRKFWAFKFGNVMPGFPVQTCVQRKFPLLKHVCTCLQQLSFDPLLPVMFGKHGNITLSICVHQLFATHFASRIRFAKKAGQN